MGIEPAAVCAHGSLMDEPVGRETVDALLSCPRCGREMCLFGIEPDPEAEKRELYTFECDQCGAIEVRGVRLR